MSTLTLYSCDNCGKTVEGRPKSWFEVLGFGKNYTPHWFCSGACIVRGVIDLSVKQWNDASWELVPGALPNGKVVHAFPMAFGRGSDARAVWGARVTFGAATDSPNGREPCRRCQSWAERIGEPD